LSGAAVRAVFLGLLRVFYPQIAVRGPLPPAGIGTIFVANHPNGLLDPLVVRLALGRPVAFLAKSTLFSIPVLRGWLRAFDAIPVYRAKEADTAQNELTFQLARGRVDGGGALALFPEGISHDEPRLAPLKTGAARIALGCDVSARIVAVGIAYESKETFRSRVSATLGPPIDLAPYRAQAALDERAAVVALTARVAAALQEVMIEADDAELWSGFVTVASWLVGDADVGVRDARARSLARDWRQLVSRDPTEAEALADEARAFAYTLSELGLRDAFALDGGAAHPIRAGAKGLALLAMLPLAAIGALLGWLPYRIIRPVSTRLAKGERDVVGTYKLLIGLVLMPAWWCAQAAMIGYWLSWGVGLAVLALAPLTGFAALRFDERLTARRALLRASWLTATRADEARAVADRRRALAERITQATRAHSR
jgi:1-acyl-sn-glycerol-3-phosphate acyltransferase